MRTIIAGSRGATEEDTLVAIDNCTWNHNISVVISGTCRGPDKYGEAWANSKNIPIERYPADWKSLGKAAGPFRNLKMADNADALIAVRKGKSRGTSHMIKAALDRGLRVFVYEVDEKRFWDVPSIKDCLALTFVERIAIDKLESLSKNTIKHIAECLENLNVIHKLDNCLQGICKACIVEEYTKEVKDLICLR